MKHFRPPPPAAHIKLTPTGAVQLCAAGAFGSLSMLGIAALVPLFALPCAVAAGVLLALARLDARAEYPAGMYSRSPGGFVWRPEPIEPTPPSPVDLDELQAAEAARRASSVTALARLAASGTSFGCKR